MPFGHVAVQRVVRRGLIGDDVGRHAARTSSGRTSAALPSRRDRARAALALPALDPLERRRRGRRLLVDVAGREPALDPLRIDFDDQRDAAVHRDRERLRAAHAAEAGGHDQPAAQVAAEVPAADRGQRLVGALQDALRADVDPAARGHLAVHRQAAVFEIAESIPGRPRRHEQRVGDQDARAPTDACGTPRPVCPTARPASRRARGGAACRRSRRTPPSCAPRARSAVDDQIVGPLGDRRDRDCSSACAARLPAATPCRRSSPRAAR